MEFAKQDGLETDSFSQTAMCFFYSGGEVHARGVAIAIKKELTKFILGCWTLSDRVMVLKLKDKKFDVNIIQAYAPTSMSTEEEIATFYEQLDMAYKTCKSQEIKILMGDSEKETIGEILLFNGARKKT